MTWRLIVPLSVFAMLALATGATASPATNSKVTDHAYVAWGHNPGYTDTTLAKCSVDKRQQNEPTIAQDPRSPNILVAGSNDYCGVPSFGDAWAGFYISHDHGATWVDSLIPGYPTDTSSAGAASPIHGIGASGDPVADWDNLGNLFYGGIAFNRVKPSNGDFWVATYGNDASTYVRTVIVGEGTPSAAGRFNDKPTIKVDQWSTSSFQNRVYVAWAIFMGVAGNNGIFVSFSADHGATFSRPAKVSEGIHGSQGTDIAIAPDGTAYIFWRTFAERGASQVNGIAMAKSTDGGESWSKPAIVQEIIGYDRHDVHVTGIGARDCGDGPFACLSGYTFHREDSLPAAVADDKGNLYVAWAQMFDPHATGTTYGPGGQAKAVISKSTDGGESWSSPKAIDNVAKGHQFWPDLAFGGGTIYAVYYDSRNDPAYSENRPPGNDATGKSLGPSLDTYASTSSDGGKTWTSMRVSTVSHNPNYEMFGGRRVPFHGDYIWVTTTLTGTHAHVAWTDNRDVVAGVDIRDAATGHVDGNDVLQCRATPTSPDTCPSAGGLNQNIYSAKVMP